MVRVCMVSDFFLPNTGGVESHIFHLATRLSLRGHDVVVVTHNYGNRNGIRLIRVPDIKNFKYIKVYYLPLVPFYSGAILPTIMATLPYFRHILLTESIDIVHGHSAFSTMGNEAIWTGQLLNLCTAFTDHSLFGFADLSAIVTNKFQLFNLTNIDACICVSHVGKENTVLRFDVHPQRVYVIPNAVDTNAFYPSKEDEIESERRRRKHKRIVVAVGSRLVYRKGIDVLVAVIPEICRRSFGTKKDYRVDFIIAGDGPKGPLVQEMIDRYNLGRRVTMLGELDHSSMRSDLLLHAHIFLNTSLTEAFCIALVEAVACGLTVVSTRVGGIPEVLPDKFVYWACTIWPDDVIDALSSAVEDVIAGKRPSKRECFEFVHTSYNWEDVAERTEVVYTRILSEHRAECRLQRNKLAQKVRNIWERGAIAGPLYAMLFVLCHYWMILMDAFRF